MSAQEKNLKVINPRLGIYYVILAVITAVVLVFSFVTYGLPASANVSYDLSDTYAVANTLDTERNIFTDGNAVLENSTAYKKGLDVVKAELDKISGMTKAEAAKASNTTDKTSTSQKITAGLASTKGTYVIQDFSQDDIDFTIDADTINAMGKDEDYISKENIVIAARQVKNIIVEIPGTNHGKDTQAAVLFMTHYDSQNNSNGAMSAASTAAMIGTIKNVMAGSETYSNDLVFVFTEGRYEDSVGAYAFLYQFTGFDKVTSNIKAAFNFDAMTAGGALSIVQAANATTENPNDIYADAIAATNVRSDFYISDILDDYYFSDYNAFYNYADEEWTIPAVNFVMTRGTYDAGSQFDTAAYADIESAAGQYASAMEKLVNAFGSKTINYGSSLTGAGINLYGLGIGLNGIALLVFAILALLVMIGFTVYGMKEKELDLREIFKGTGIVLLTGAIACGVGYGVYFLASLLTVALGGFTLAQVYTNAVLSALLLIPSVVLGVGVSFGCFSMFKRLLHLKAKDCVKSVGYIFTIAGFVLTFAYTRFALLFLVIGCVLTIVNFVTLLLKKSSNKKGVSYPYGKLFVNYIAAILYFGVLTDFALTVCNTFGSIFLPLMILPYAVLLATITPYFNKITPVMEDFAEKLPKHTVKVERLEVVKIEDEAKKGKFVEAEQLVVTEEKVAWQYKNWKGVAIVIALAVVAVFICSAVSAYTQPAGKNVTDGLSFLDTGIEKTIYDDSIVFCKDGSTSSGTYKMVIKDSQVYNAMRKIDGYDYWEWTYDEDNKEYVHAVSTKTPISGGSIISSESDGGFVINVNPNYPASSQVILELKNVKSGDIVTVTKSGETMFKYTYQNPSDTVKFALPYGFGACAISFESSSDSSISAVAREYVTTANAINNDAKEKMLEILAEEKLSTEFTATLKFGFIIESSI